VTGRAIGNTGGMATSLDTPLGRDLDLHLDDGHAAPRDGGRLE
jgi:hypothetical protein